MPELTRRYIVMAMASEAPFDAHDPEAPFVLKPWKDPAALRALETYRDHCYPELAADLTAWIHTVGAGARVRGGVGARNEAHMASRPKPRPAAQAAKAKAGVAKKRAAKKLAAKKPVKRKGKRRS
ncbi:MAG: hypothetical protein ACREJY_08010 [Candidatus Rokuibacteriota bacterium]